ncbi:Ribonucleoside-diphosphate reductase large subunit [Ananas comosus]|uniref:Ribonucleoside-diphosphate reductase large subunit n=1 Tax=Ananas comosus TaxID=4615 RepID=A0A199VRH2_ANACO|nr:Ribonucleoside-diphosphate reductase large subunit [Ananas comosus]
MYRPSQEHCDPVLVAHKVCAGVYKGVTTSQLAGLTREIILADFLADTQEEEILWKTRAKQLWLKEGDGNTKFFHAVANGRKRNNSIETIENDAGQQISNEELKRSFFFRSFTQAFGQADDNPPSFGDWSGLYQSNILPNPDSLTTPFTLDEVKVATFQLGSDKAPGPDGFPLLFFQTFWESVKEDIFWGYKRFTHVNR